MDIEKLKKIDWAKCKLPNIDKGCSGLFVSVNGGKLQIAVPSSIAREADIVLATRCLSGGMWTTTADMEDMCITTLPNIFQATKDVDTFIATELARIEAEEEAKNWVNVHWRDAEWLRREKRICSAFMPKPEPRPCSKEFALKHPNESEWRCGAEWGPVNGWIRSPGDTYEFRTTAKAEVRPRVVAEIPAEFAVSGVTIHFENSDLFARGLCLAKEGKNPRIALIVDEEA